ncbi:MAG: hypothetical protein H5U40_08580, partial [Polyangiaceae bacterium]|nr:hypothetical protein [Polyangiaceae bacterium]
VVRDRAGGPKDDAIVLTIASPTERGLVASEVWIHPGITGRLAGLVLVGAPGARLRAASGARVVEAARDGGYDIEAFVPFAAIPGARDWQRGRGAIRLNDVDQETGRIVPTVHASADASDVERLPYIGGAGYELGSFAGFLRDRGVERDGVSFDLRGDIAGDARAERVVIAAGHVAAMGAGYRDGASYTFAGLGELTGAGVVSAELRDLTGDRKNELLVTTESRGPEGIRRIASIYGFADGRIELLWGAVIGLRNRSGKIEGRIEVVPVGRGAPRLVVHAGTAEGIGPEGFRFDDSGPEVALLPPWGPVASQSYQYSGGRFARVSETPNRAYRPPEATPAPVATRPTPAQTTPAPAPRAPTSEQLVAAVRRERRIPASTRARFELRANVAEDPRPEDLLVLGNTLVVVGPGFRGGQGYFHFDIPVASPADLLDVSTADVTGDGRHEILVRIRQQLGQGFEREVLLVHRFTSTGFPRALAV